jgi:transposase
MEDKKSLKPMVKLHQELFGENSLSSFTADKGFYSNNNKQALIEANVKEIGLQQPRLKGSLPEDIDKDTRHC